MTVARECGRTEAQALGTVNEEGRQCLGGCGPGTLEWNHGDREGRDLIKVRRCLPMLRTRDTYSSPILEESNSMKNAQLSSHSIDKAVVFETWSWRSVVLRGLPSPSSGIAYTASCGDHRPRAQHAQAKTAFPDFFPDSGPRNTYACPAFSFYNVLFFCAADNDTSL
ncbi:hypothetical protein EI94DRAFT_1698623 [Lactarius quietus]|nr:hypothetical protein EI94DRAFT_1698623 [Lactarius quietus]